MESSNTQLRRRLMALLDRHGALLLSTLGLLSLLSLALAGQ